MRILALGFALIVGLSWTLGVSGQEWAKSALQELKQNPKNFHQIVPRKSNSKGVLPRQLQTYFVPGDLADSKYVEKKMAWRQKKFNLLDGKSPMADLGPKSLPELLVDEEVLPLVKSLPEMEEQRLMRGRLAEVPWSGDYWAISRGILGARPFVKDYTQLESWQTRFDWIVENHFWKVFETGVLEDITRLGVAEKMDLLHGDQKASFTSYMWNQGYQYKDEDGNVEDWMGICHGWAPAAYMVPRPTKTITLKAFDGKTDLKIYPSELKGLVTQLWAKAPYDSRHIGGRCNKKEPERDENGRLTDPDCFDINPGAWHLAVVNQIGRAKRSFVLDITYDYEVWNQPVYAYEYYYFNPQTKKMAKTLEEAAVTPEEFVSDPYKKYRGTEVKQVVGVAMRIGYIVELGAGEREEEGQDWDQIHWVEYLYDLEIDSSDQISGGEWYSQAHPDFLWGATPNARPYSPVDNYIKDGVWDSDQPLPEKWREIFIQIAPYGYQAAKFLDLLVDLSRQGLDEDTDDEEEVRPPQ